MRPKKERNVDIFSEIDHFAAFHEATKKRKKAPRAPCETIWRAPRRGTSRRSNISNRPSRKSRSRPCFNPNLVLDTPAETKPLSEAELEEEHDRIISNIQSLTRKYAAPESASSTSHTWSSRRSREASNWEAVREELQYSLLVRQGVPLEQKCCQCQSEYVSVRCEDCNFSYYCALCDSDRHAWEPFHCRQFVVSGGERFDYVGPCTELEEGDQGEVHQRYKEKYLNNILVMPDRCPGCDGESTVTLKTWGTCIVVTMKGRFDIFLPQLQCSQCEYVKKPGISEIVRIGFWPGNSNITPGMYIFDEELFFLFDHLKKEKPGLSVRAWLSTLEYTSIMKNRHGKISHKVFSESLREWQRCQFYLGTVQGVDLMKCPACFHGMHGCHCDGNRKVYRFKGHNQSTEENYYKDVFIASDERVDEFVKTVKGTLVKVDNDQCGQTHWQAARTSSKSMKHLAETGLVVACCRHNVLLKAVNMFQGEIFAYPLFIQQELALQHEIKFFCQDVICKYWPWLSRIKERLNQTSFAEAATKAASMQPFLSVIHAKSHDWTCQILWGGRKEQRKPLVRRWSSVTVTYQPLAQQPRT